MNWTSEPLHLNPNTCVDVHATAKTIVLAYVSDRATFGVHLTADQAIQLADYLTEAATKLLADGGGV